MVDQILDSMELERERGITIKSKAVHMKYHGKDGQDYELNLIDTPGHVDFTYEVSRSLAACEGAVLVVDATQGIEAQTLANVYLALDNNLEILPVVNKIDLPAAEPQRVKDEIEEIIGIPAQDAPEISAKAGINIDAVLDDIVQNVPAPSGDPTAPLKALIFDSQYDNYRGVIVFLRLIDGCIRRDSEILLMSTGAKYKVVEVGHLRPIGLDPCEELSAGGVGYFTASIKNVADTQVGDTVTEAARPTATPLPGYRPARPMVYCGIYTEDGSKYPDLRDALEKLQLNDAAFPFEMNVTENSISDTYAYYEGIGDWDGSSVFGRYGAVLSGSDEMPFTIGGTEDVFRDETFGDFNTVIVLDAQDRDEENALIPGQTRDYKDAQEGAEGAGIYAAVPGITLDNVYVRTVGYGRSALHTTTDVEETVIRDSTIIALGSDGADSSAPGVICMYASSRPLLIESSGCTYIYNSDLISSDWGVYSLDGCYGANVYIVDDYSLNTVGGYSMYALGFAAGQENSTYFYGSYAASAQYGTILCAAGRTYAGALADAPAEALVRMDGSTLRAPVLKNGWSYIGGRLNAVTMQADMSGAEIVGVLDATHTVFDTLAVLDRDGKPLDDTMDLYDYKDDAALGAAHYFLTKLHGAAFGIRSENVDMTLDDCMVFSSNDVAIQTVIGYDNMASNIKVPDGTEYHGADITVKNMALTGDVLHEDYQRKMVLSLENATLTGAVVSGTCAAWNHGIAALIDAEWTGYDDQLGHSKDAVLGALCPDEAYETIWGVRMSLDGGSAWTVTGDSSLNSLTLAEGAQIIAPAGHSLEIYVNCAMNGGDDFYDYSTGTRVPTLAAGQYTGVVILVK